MTNIPTLETDRLTLRASTADDFEPYANFMASERSSGMGGPVDRNDAWRRFAMLIGHWHLRGYGSWHTEEKTTGKPVGMFGFWNPEGWLGRELGWLVYDGFEGKGYAYEATRYLVEYARNTLKWDSLVSVIAPNNARSMALAKRLGASYENDWTTPFGKTSAIYRHPTLDQIGGDGGMEAYV